MGVRFRVLGSGTYISTYIYIYAYLYIWGAENSGESNGQETGKWKESWDDTGNSGARYKHDENTRAICDGNELQETIAHYLGIPQTVMGFPLPRS